MVLVTVLLIVTLASMTAVYAVQGAATEIQAAGSMKTAMMTRAMSESLVAVGASVMDELTANGSLAASQLPLMERYNLPDVVVDATHNVGALTLVTDDQLDTPIPTDAQLRGPVGLPASGSVSAYRPTVVAIQENYKRGAATAGEAQMNPRRIAITIFGEVELPGEIATLVGSRGLHTTVRVSQAYFDVVVKEAK